MRHIARWRQRPLAAITPNQGNRRILVPKRPPVALPTFVLDFDGATSAKMAQPWVPYSKQYSATIRSLFKGDYGDFGRLLDGGIDARHLMATPTNIQWRYPVQPSPTLEFLSFGTHALNTVYDTELNGHNGNGLVELTVSGGAASSDQSTAPADWADNLQIQTIGSNQAQTGSYFVGYLANLLLQDRSPIQGRPYVVGNSSRHVLLANEFVLSGAGGWRIDFDYVYNAGNANERICGSSSDANNQLTIFGPGTGNPHAIQLRIGGSFSAQWPIMAEIAQGEQVSVGVEHPPGGNAVNFYINGRLYDSRTSAALLNDYTLGELMRGATSPLQPGSAIANFSAVDTASGNSWFYAMGEGSGLAIVNSGNTAGGGTDYDGTLSGTDAALGWLDDKPINSIEFPMREGEGTSFLAYEIGSGIRRPEYDAAITGTGGWEEPVAGSARVDI